MRDLSNTREPSAAVFEEVSILDDEIDELEKREVYWAQRSRQESKHY